MLRTADPDADLEHALGEWRRFRRRKRLADIHWIDAAYQAYLTAIVCGAAVLFLSSAVGDRVLDLDGLASVRDHGPDWLGALAAVVVAIGLRSGARGGPLALERAEVFHVLLAPVDRTTALRGPVVRQLRFLAFVALLAGGLGGNLASHRLGTAMIPQMACGALFALAVVVATYGAAVVASSFRIPSPVASGLGLALIGAGVADGLGAFEGSPMTAWGHLALWPVAWSPTALGALAVTVVLAGVAWLRVGDLPLERAEQRSSLVGQLRFAATMQDLRTVMVLRRQLAQEQPRLKPWIRLRGKGSGRVPVWTRGWRGVLRWPAARVGRLLVLGVVAGLCMRGVWDGTTPLLIPAGLALFVAGLDAVEPLAQEVDHPSRADTVPTERGAIHVRHLPVAIAVMVLVAVVAVVAALVSDPSVEALGLGLLLALPAALGGAAAGTTSVLMGTGEAARSGVDSNTAWSMSPPEFAGMRLVMKAAWSPALAIGGLVPVLAARWAYGNEDAQVPAVAAMSGLLVVVLFVGVAGWVRTRDQMQSWWDAQLRTAFPDRNATNDDQADDQDGEQAAADDGAGTQQDPQDADGSDDDAQEATRGT